MLIALKMFNKSERDKGVQNAKKKKKSVTFDMENYFDSQTLNL
jgi:hypothetical protein